MSKPEVWYLVSGRRDGDDEDTTLIFEATDSEAAETIFRHALAGHLAEDGTSGQDRESYSDTQDRDSYTVDDDWAPVYDIYVNTIVRCGTTKPVIEYDEH